MLSTSGKTVRDVRASKKRTARNGLAARILWLLLDYRFRPAAGRAAAGRVAFTALAGAALKVRTGAETRAGATGVIDVLRITGGATRGAGGVTTFGAGVGATIVRAGVGVMIVRGCRTGPEFTIFAPDVIGAKLRVSLMIFGIAPAGLVVP